MQSLPYLIFFSAISSCLSFTLPNLLLRNGQVKILPQNGGESIKQRSDLHELHAEPKLRSEEWAKLRGMTPGYGGYWPGDPNAKTYKVTMKSLKSGDEYTLQVPEDRYIYFYFEEQGIDLPVINKQRMCRQGCCTICTMKVLEGKVKMDTPLGLLKELRKEGYALSCCAYPQSDLVCELQDEDEMYIKQWSEGFEGGGVQWGGVLPEDD